VHGKCKYFSQITLPPLALRPAFPDPSAGRHARDYYGGSAPHHRPSADDVPSLPHAGSRAGGDPWAVPTFTDRSIDG